RSQNAAQHTYERLQEQLAKMTDRAVKEKLEAHISHEIEQLREQMNFQGLYKYVSFLYPERHTLLDYVAEDTVVMIDEPIRLLETAKQLEREEAELTTSLLQE